MELIHTSAPRGLKAGSRGFTTVAHTKGMPAWLSETLERLSGYRFVAEAAGPDAERNLIVYRHARLVRGSESFTVLSRIAPCSADYSGRSNRIAHHLILDVREHVTAGPAWLLGRDDLFRSEWNEEPRLLDPLRSLPDADVKPLPCRGWQHATGDAGWAGEMLRRWLDRPDQPLYVRHPADWGALGLLGEAAALLPPEQRWKLTFQTGVTDDLPTGMTCALRYVPQLAGVRANIRGIGAHNTLDLFARVTLGDSEYAQKARRGESVEAVISRAAAGARKVAVAAPRKEGTSEEPRALDEAAVTADTPYELAPLDDLPLDDGLSAAPAPCVPIPTVPQRRRPSWLVLAAGAAVVLCAIVVGTKLFSPSREETGIVGKQRRPGAATQMASSTATQPTGEPAGTVTPESEQEDERENQTQPANNGALEGDSPSNSTTPEEFSPTPGNGQPTAKPVHWAESSIDTDDIKDFEFDRAVLVRQDEGDAELSGDWLTNDGALQVAWLAGPDGSKAPIFKTPELSESNRDDRLQVLRIFGFWGDARPPVAEVTASAKPQTEKLELSFEFLDAADARLGGFCLRHPDPSEHRAILFLTNVPALDRLELEWVEANNGGEAGHYEGRGTVRNWVQDRNRLWKYTRKRELRVAEFGNSSGREPPFRAEIQGRLNRECQQVRVFIAAEAMPEPADDDTWFLKQLRAALQPTNKKEQPQRLVTLPNVYGVPMIELIFPEPEEKDPASQPSPGDPNSHSSKEAA